MASKSGGEATGILLSLVQSCRVLDIDPFVYLDDILRRLPVTADSDLPSLLPHTWQAARA